MAIYLVIIIGVVVGFMGRRAGFVSMWTMLFNVLISIYISIMLSPTIIGLLPSLNTSDYYRAMCLLGIAIFVFAVAHNILSMYLPEVFSVAVPKLFDGWIAGIAGFFVGFFVSSFIIFIFAVTPLSRTSVIKKISPEETLGQAVSSPVLGACKIVSELSLQGDKRNCRKVVKWFIKPTTGYREYQSNDQDETTSGDDSEPQRLGTGSHTNPREVVCQEVTCLL